MTFHQMPTSCFIHRAIRERANVDESQKAKIICKTFVVDCNKLFDWDLAFSSVLSAFCSAPAAQTLIKFGKS